MRLLIDTDAFCKLAVVGLLADAVELLGADLTTECGRLPALPHMLRRGKLRKHMGDEACDLLVPVAESVPVIGSASSTWLDKLTPIEAIDPGEAQLFAVAAEAGLVVVTGDRRALRALKAVAGFGRALAGRIVVMEAILIALCDSLGAAEVHRRVVPLASRDKMVQVCFSAGTAEPQVALLSYYRATVAELDPLVLWNPRAGVTA